MIWQRVEIRAGLKCKTTDGYWWLADEAELAPEADSTQNGRGQGAGAVWKKEYNTHTEIVGVPDQLCWNKL